MSLVLEGGSRRLVPDVATAGMALHAKGLALEVVVGQHAEGRDDVLAEILVLIVAPDDHEIGVEGVQFLPNAAETGHQAARCSSDEA